MSSPSSQIAIFGNPAARAHSTGRRPPKDVEPSTADGLVQRVFDNSALFGVPVSLSVVPHIALNQAALSAVWDGVLVPVRSGDYHFACEHEGGHVIAWVDDRLVCATSPCERCVGGKTVVNSTHPNWLPLPLRAGHNHTVRFEFRAGSRALHRVGLQWALAGRAVPKFGPIGILRPWRSIGEREREAVQQRVAAGWGPWYRSDMLTQAHLPDLFSVAPAVVQISTSQREGGKPLNGSFGAVMSCPCYAGGENICT